MLLNDFKCRNKIGHDFIIIITMHCFRFAKRFTYPLWSLKNRYQFAKNSDNKNSSNDPPQNQNYFNSRKPIQKKEKQQDQIQKKLQQLNRNDELNLKMLIMSNTALIGIIPFWQPIGVAITLLNGGFLLNHFGNEFKKYLLIINNGQINLISSFRSPQQYLKLFLHNVTILVFQSIFLSISSYGVSHLLTMLWFGINIYFEVIPKAYSILILPLLIALLVNTFGAQIKDFLLGGQKIRIDIPISSIE